MGKKDIVDRPYFSDCERFAELMNVALYHGRRVLYNVPYKVDTASERDCLKC